MVLIYDFNINEYIDIRSVKFRKSYGKFFRGYDKGSRNGKRSN